MKFSFSNKASEHNRAFFTSSSNQIDERLRLRAFGKLLSSASHRIILASALLATVTIQAAEISGISTSLSRPGDVAGANYTAGNGNTFSFHHYEVSNGITGIHLDSFTLASAVSSGGSTNVNLLTAGLNVTIQRANLSSYSNGLQNQPDAAKRESIIYTHNGLNNNNYQIYGGRNNYMVESLTGSDLSDGAENIFLNSSGDAYAKNIERIDYVHQDGFRITQENYEDIGFAFFERGANNVFHIAAITEVDSAGNATAFGDLVKFGDNSLDYGPELDSNNHTLYGLPNSNFDFDTIRLNGVPDPNNPASFDYQNDIDAGNTQGIGGIYLTLADLGLSASGQDVFYGYALFAGDANANDLNNNYGGVIPLDVNDPWYNKNTNSTNGGGDLYGGAMLFNPDDFTVDLGQFTPLGQNYYWDLNGATAGSGVFGASPDPNIWNTDLNSTAWGGITGQLATDNWAAGKTAYFSAGTDANGNYTVEVDDNPVARGMVFEEGHAMLKDNNATAGEITLAGFVNNQGTPSTADDVNVKPFIRVNAGAQGTVDVDISSASGGIDGLSKTGNGILYLGGDNSFTGNFDLEAGEVYVRNGNAITDTAQVTLYDNTAFRLQSNETIGSLRDKVANSETGEVHLNGNKLRVGIDNSSTTFSGLINGGITSQFTKEGTGTMTITGENTFSGLTKVDGGIMLLDSDSGAAISNRIEIGSQRSNTQQGTDILRIAQDDQIGDTAHITINGSGRLDLNGYNEEIGDLASAYTTAQVTLGTATNDNSIITIQQDGETTYKGSITGNGAQDELILYGGGSLRVEGAVDFDGFVRLRGDTNTVAASTSPATLTLGTSNIVNDNINFEFDGGRLRLDGVNEEINQLDLNASSFLDFSSKGNGTTTGIFTFAELTGGPNGTLSVENWVGNVAAFSGNTFTSGGSGDNQLLVRSNANLGSVATLSTTVANHFNFLGYGEAVYIDVSGNGTLYEILPSFNGFFEWDGGNGLTNGGTQSATGDFDHWTVLAGNSNGADTTWVDGAGQYGLGGPKPGPNSNTAQVLFGVGVEDGHAINLGNAVRSNGNGSIGSVVDANKTVKTMAVTTDSAFSIFSNSGKKLIFDHNSGGTAALSLSNSAQVTFDAGVDFADNFTILQSSDRTLTFNQNITQTTAAADIFRVTGSGDTVINGNLVERATGNDSFNIIKDGTGTLTLNGSHTVGTSGGQTILNNGILRLANTNQNNTTLQSSTIEINGGTLLIDDSNQINNNTNIILSGGTLKLGGNSASETESLGTLTLNGNSTIDFGGADWTLAFADSSGVTWDEDAILTITNWGGTPVNGNGADQLFFGTDSLGLTSQQLSQIRFADYPGSPNLHLVDGEVVPVPEPKFYFGGGMLLTLIVWFERRRRKSRASEIQ